MSSRDRKTRASFQTLNQAASPEPEFAARLRARLLSEAEPELRPSPVTPFDQPSGAAPASRKRTCWLDIAAVAALFLSMIGGMTGLPSSTGDDATPTIQAPDTIEPPVTWNGTAAGGRLFPGPAPISGDYELRWTAEEGVNELIWPVIPSGDLIFGFSPHRGDLAGQTMRALDAESGAIAWEREAENHLGFAVTDRGVVVAVPIADRAALGEDAPTATFQIALLGRDTGEPIWVSSRGYGFAEQLPPNLVVDETTIYFAIGEGAVFAIDLETGQERWRSAYDRICDESLRGNASCAERKQYGIELAAGGGNLYLSDPVTAMVKALATENGQEQWTVVVAERAGLLPSQGAMIAIDGGLVIQFLGSPSNGTQNLSYLSLWSAESGTESWRTFEFVVDAIWTGISLFVSLGSREGGCCTLAELEPETGETQRSRSWDGPVYGYLTESDTIITYRVGNAERRDPGDVFQFTSLAGLDATTWEEVWQFAPPDLSCLLLLPVLRGGNVVCQQNDDRLRMSVYGPARSETQSSPEATPQSDPAVMIGGTAAQGNQYPGPAPTASRYTVLPDVGPLTAGWHGPALTYGRWVYVSTTSNSGETTLEAVNLETGVNAWQHALVRYGSFAVTPRGVIAMTPAAGVATAEPDYGAPPFAGPFNVALLDRETGEVIWRSPQRYESEHGPSLLVDDHQIYVSDRDGSIFALDLNTGEEQWRYSYERILADGLDPQVCLPGLEPSGNCWDRSTEVIPMAVEGATLYFADPVTARVTALAVQDGSERWQVFAADRAQGRASSVGLIALDHGVVVQLVDQQVGTTTDAYLGFWSADDGRELWTTERQPGGIASDGTSLFSAGSGPDGACCAVSRIDARTGELGWTVSVESASTYGYLSYPSSGSIILAVMAPITNERPPHVEHLVGMDPETGAVTWRVELRGNCNPIFPVGDDGTIACLDTETGLWLYRPASDTATPAASYAAGSIVEVTVDGVRLRDDPSLAPNTILTTYEAGERLEIISGPIAGAEETTWYEVRNVAVGQDGYILANFIELTGQP